MLLSLPFWWTDKHMGNREIISQTSGPEPASEDNSLGYKGKWVLVLLSFLWTEWKKEIDHNSRTDVFIYTEVLMSELGCICWRSMFVPIPHLSFEGHKKPWKILDLGLGFLLLTKNIIPHNASSAAPDLKCCVQSQHDSNLPSICHLLGESLTRAVTSFDMSLNISTLFSWK